TPIRDPSVLITSSRRDSGRSTGRMRTEYEATLLTSGRPARSKTMPRDEGSGSSTVRVVAASAVYWLVAPTWIANRRAERAPAHRTTDNPKARKRRRDGPLRGRSTT